MLEALSEALLRLGEVLLVVPAGIQASSNVLAPEPVGPSDDSVLVGPAVREPGGTKRMSLAKELGERLRVGI